MRAQVIQFDVSNDTVRKQITGELRTLYDSHHAFIVRYYQAYFEGGCVIVIMEHMDAGTLAHLVARLGGAPLPEPHLAVLARQVPSCTPLLQRRRGRDAACCAVCAHVSTTASNDRNRMQIDLFERFKDHDIFGSVHAVSLATEHPAHESLTGPSVFQPSACVACVCNV